jgi:hypothetical protein
MPPSTTAQTRHYRARLANMSRYRDHNDPEIADVRRRLAEETLVAAVERAVSEAPPLTPEVRTRIIGLLVGGAE